MEAILIYFLKVNSLLIAFYLLYKVLCAKQSWFQMNRFTILGLSMLAMIVPFYQPSVAESTDLIWQIQLPEMAIEPQTVESNGIGLFNLILILYGIVCSILLVLVSKQLFQIITQKGGELIGEYRIFSTTNNNTSSFFKWIFISQNLDEETKNIALKHEKVHADQWHSADILWFELLSVMLWVNPTIWLFKRELRYTHEYIADTNTRNTVGQKEYVNALLKNTFQTNTISIIPMFSNSQTLINRINMMKKNKPVVKLRYLLLLPIIGAVTLVSAISQQNNINITPVENAVQEVYNEVEKMPEFPGGQEALFKYLSSNLQYPKEAAKENIEGKVFVSFVVTSKGSITKTEVLRGVNEELDNEAMRVINAMPNWTPGEKDGKKVNVKFTLPIMFKLN